MGLINSISEYDMSVIMVYVRMADDVLKNYPNLSYDDAESFAENFLNIADNMGKGRVRLLHGASKAAIVIDNIDYVIKIPFVCNYDYDFDTDSYEKKEFRYVDKDYCDTEYRIYQDAVRDHVTSFLAAIDRLMYNGKYYYIQEKVRTFEENDIKKTSRVSQAFDLMKDNSKPLSCCDAESSWINDCYSCYGLVKCFNFFNIFCSENKHGTLLEDMYYFNYGFRKDGSPCILDYATYMDG